MSLAEKLQIPKGAKLRVVNAPPGFKLHAPTSAHSEEAILLFVRDSEALNTTGKPAFEAAKADRLAWIAYPKAKQLGTDLSRDVLWRLVKPLGIQPVRQVSIDDTWSALRFRPA